MKVFHLEFKPRNMTALNRMVLPAGSEKTLLVWPRPEMPLDISYYNRTSQPPHPRVVFDVLHNSDVQTRINNRKKYMYQHVLHVWTVKSSNETSAIANIITWLSLSYNSNMKSIIIKNEMALLLIWFIIPARIYQSLPVSESSCLTSYDIF